MFQNQIEIKMMLQPDFKKFCWNCNIGGGATSEELKERCLGEGSYQACSSGNSDCFVTMRKNEGKVNMLQMGCKQPAACANESSQTMQGQSPHCRHSFITRIWPIQTDIDWNPRHLKTLWTLGLVHRWRLYKRLLHRKREFWEFRKYCITAMKTGDLIGGGHVLEEEM